MSMTNSAGIGTVAALWRYPVKSMLGEELDESAVTQRGLVGDRGYALIDKETGKLVSAKRPRLWGQMFFCRAAFVAQPSGTHELPAVRMTLPDGSSITTDDPEVEAVLSGTLGRAVTLSATPPAKIGIEEEWLDSKGSVKYGEVSSRSEAETIVETPAAFAAPGTFFDLSALHIVTTATLNRLQEAYPGGEMSDRRFRPNIVVDTPGASGFVENEWSGRVLRIGDEVRVQVMVPMVRCVMTTLPQPGLERDPGILRTVAQHNMVPVMQLGDLPCVGVAANVMQGGTVRRGDAVVLE